MGTLLVLTLQFIVAAAWRSKGEPRLAQLPPSSLLELSTGELENVSTLGASKVVCTRRLPYFRNKLCVEVKSHTDDLVKFVTASNTSDGLQNPIALPDVTLDFAWMGCSRCTPEMRVCSPGQPCRKDPSGSLNFPWIRIMALSLKSLVAGQCVSLAQMLVAPSVSVALMPFLEQYTGALAPYLGSIVGYTSSRLLDELLLGRYCIYLTTHVAGEVVAGKTLTQDVRCIDHLYTIHIPGFFGIIPSREVSNPESSLVCWPTAEALEKEKVDAVLESMDAMDEAEDEDEEEDMKIPVIPSPELLSKDKVCRQGPSSSFCAACKTVAQAATWRMERLREVAQKAGLHNAEDELGVVESRMLIHANTKEQCRGDRDPKCLDDYSLCVLKPGMEDAKECNGQTAHWPAKEIPACTNLCTNTCGKSAFYGKPHCSVPQDVVGQSCRLNRAPPYRYDVVQADKFRSGAWVHCGTGPVAMYNIHWQHRLLKIIAMRKLPDTSVEDREHAGRQVMQIFSEPTVTASNATMMDVLVLRLAQQMGTARNLNEAGDSVCHDAACCE